MAKSKLRFVLDEIHRASDDAPVEKEAIVDRLYTLFKSDEYFQKKIDIHKAKAGMDELADVVYSMFIT